MLPVQQDPPPAARAMVPARTPGTGTKMISGTISSDGLPRSVRDNAARSGTPTAFPAPAAPGGPDNPADPSRTTDGQFPPSAAEAPPRMAGERRAVTAMMQSGQLNLRRRRLSGQGGRCSRRRSTTTPPCPSRW